MPDRSRLLDQSLLHGALPVVVLVLGGLGAVVLLWPRGPARRWWLRAVPLAVAGGVGASGVVALVSTTVVAQPLPPSIWGWLAAALVGVALAGAAWLLRTGRAAATAAALLVLLTAFSGVNRYYGEVPTIRTALGVGYADEVAFASVPARVPAAGPVWTPPAGMPATGRVAQVDIPAPVSGFDARPGWVYLPPAYLTGARPELPVLVLLAGQPGEPRDWLDGGQLASRMDRFAAAHDGLAPVVVMPDALGSELADPLCLDSRLGHAATYLGVDVPAWVRAHLQVDADPARWAVGGLSSGGTCSLQLALTVPEVYPTFLSISGESEPSLGSRDETVLAAFGPGPDAELAFRAVNPLDRLTTRRYPGTAGMLVAGTDDTQFRPQAQRVLAALDAAGIPATLLDLPGGHTWGVWGPGLEASLPWLAARLGLTP